MAPEFKPGTFEPVITVSQRCDGNTRAFHGVSDGLAEVSESALYVAFATSMGSGSNTEFSRSAVPGLSKIYGQYLWARNLSNQLNKVGINNRFSRDLNAEFDLPEPIVKLFNAYGHVEHEDVTYVQLDLEREFSHAVLNLADMMTDFDINEAEPTVGDITEDKYLRRLMLDHSGNIFITSDESIRCYVNRLIAHISGRKIDPEFRLRLIKQVIDVATERDLAAAMRYLRSYNEVGELPARAQHQPDAAFSTRIQRVLGEHHPTLAGSVLDSKRLSRAIRNVVEVIRRATDELCVSMAVTKIPRYEQGSIAQMAETTEDVTYSHFPLSLADATVSAAFKVGYALRRFLRSAPELTEENLRGDLVRKSVRRRA